MNVATLPHGSDTLPPTPIAQLGGLHANGPHDVATQMPSAFGALGNFVQARGLVPVGAPMAVYYDVDAAGHTRFAVGIPIEPPTDRVRPAHRAHVTVRPGGRILHFLHVGSYDTLSETYTAIGEWMVQHGLMRSPVDWERYLPMWEEYLDDPATTPAAELRTRIVIPLPE